MLLKIWNERTNDFVFLGNVKNFNVRKDLAIHFEKPTDYSSPFTAVKCQYVNPEDNHDRISPIDFENCKADCEEKCEGLKVDDPLVGKLMEKRENLIILWELKKNIHVLYPTDNFYINDDSKYSGEDVYKGKRIEINNDGNNDLIQRENCSVVSFMVPMTSPVYVLNDDGKTIDTI